MSPSAGGTVRLAVVGTGAIAQVAHLPILARMRGVEVVALCDADHAKARTLADRFGVERVYRADEELWGDSGIDGVVVCTPSHVHEEQVRAALQAGKFVLCEKPLALTAKGAKRILQTDGAESRLMVGMNQRFRPDVEALRAFVGGGELGEIRYLRTGWLKRRGTRDRRSWRERKSIAGGGAFMDLGLQMLDLALWLLGYPEPERLVAHMHRKDGDEVEDSAVLLLRLAGERVVNLEVTWALASERERQYLHLNGSAGWGSLAPLRVYKDLDGTLADVTPGVASGRENLFTASYRQQLAHFAEVVRGAATLEPPLEQIALLRVVEAAYRSAEEGNEVRL